MADALFLGLPHPCRGNGGSAGHTPPLQAATWESETICFHVHTSMQRSPARGESLHAGNGHLPFLGEEETWLACLNFPQCSACPLETREGSCPHGSWRVRETVTDVYASWSSWKLKITCSPSGLAMLPPPGPCAHSTAPKSGTSLGRWKETPLPSGVRSWRPFLSVPVAAISSTVHRQKDFSGQRPEQLDRLALGG